MKKLLFFTSILFLVSCKKDEVIAKKCAECAVTTFSASYCEGDTVLIVKNNGANLRSVPFKVSLDSFKKYSNSKYGMTCN